MQIAVIKSKNLQNEVIYRVQIALFWCLCIVFSNAILVPITDGVLYFTLAALVELFTIQAMLGLFGDTPLVCDANELNFYGFIIHLVAIPLYLHGVSSAWHNNAINGLIVLYLIRLGYFSQNHDASGFAGWAKFGALGWAHHLIGKYTTTSTKKRVLFGVRIVAAFATIIPLWVITAQTNDKKTAVVTMLITTFVLVYGYWKNIVSRRAATENNDELAALCQTYSSLSADAKQQIQQVVEQGAFVPGAQAQSADLAIEKDRVTFYATLCKGLALAFVFFLLLGLLTMHHQGKKMFVFGYAFGYSDGKNGVQPKSEVRHSKLLRCFGDGVTQPQPPDASCRDIFPK